MIKPNANQIAYLSGPIVTGDASWASTLPQWIYRAVREERAALVAEELAAGESGTRATLAEVLAYLMISSLSAPLNEETAQVLFFAAQETMAKHTNIRPALWEALGRDKKITLTDYVKQEYLHRLQHDIRAAVIKAQKRAKKSQKASRNVKIKI